MHLRSLAIVPLLVASIATVHCGGKAEVIDVGSAPAPPGPAGQNAPSPDAVGATTSSKLDLLLVVDNSAAMGDKITSLGASLGTLLRRVAPGADVHLGVISTSLGSFGGDVCPDRGASNQLAHLNATDAHGEAVPSARGGVLTYRGSGSMELDTFIADAQTLVEGVGESGCGLEAQLESAYRFLVQPDPWQKVTLSPLSQAELVGLDVTLLAQRKAFLRPDSLVAVVMLTDEDDSSPDPRSVAGQGWAFSANQFPGSRVFRADGRTTTAPRPTSACATSPGSPDCTSCGFAGTCDVHDPACQKIKSDPECQKNGGYYGPDEDLLNVRFHRMKQRYGIDPQYPISRYVEGFTKQRAPNRDGEHGPSGTTIGPYVGVASCTNPLFAASLPSGAGEELCNLPQGPRGKELVVFAVIGGVPQPLVGPNPEWTAILGANPAAFDFTGIDPHMIQSTKPRAGLPGPSNARGDNGSDPVHGREWETSNRDLQFACTFALSSRRLCSVQNPSCSCADSDNPPLCGTSEGEQLRAKAYPTIRELQVVKELGSGGVAGSICAPSYAGTMNLLADRLAPRLTGPR